MLRRLDEATVHRAGVRVRELMRDLGDADALTVALGIRTIVEQRLRNGDRPSAELMRVYRELDPEWLLRHAPRHAAAHRRELTRERNRRLRARRRAELAALVPGDDCGAAAAG